MRRTVASLRRPLAPLLVLASCAPTPPLPPPAPIALAPSHTAVVVAARPLARGAWRGDVLLVLLGTPTVAAAAGGYDLVVQTGSGRLASCISRTQEPAGRSVAIATGLCTPTLRQ
jgi:hypothetical protein